MRKMMNLSRPEVGGTYREKSVVTLNHNHFVSTMK